MTKKELSADHEYYISRIYQGERSRSSGAAVSSKGDVRTESALYECKLTGSPGGEPKRTGLLTVMEKVADEAWSEDREPIVCLRIYNPDSPLANLNGWVDMTVRMTSNDCVRERLLERLLGD